MVPYQMRTLLTLAMKIQSASAHAPVIDVGEVDRGALDCTALG